MSKLILAQKRLKKGINKIATFRNNHQIDKVVQEKEFLRQALMSQIQEKRSTFYSKARFEKEDDQKKLHAIALMK
jgi:hypothetical protein